MGMFAQAKAVAPTKPKSKKGSEKDIVEIPGVEQFAQIDALITALESLNSTLDAQLKEQAFTYVNDNSNGKRPVSFKETEGNATASMEPRKRTSRSYLTDEEVALLAKYGVNAEKVVVTQKMFGFNPVYAENQALLAKIEEALSGVDGLPEDLIVIQEEKSNMIVGESTYNQAFKSGVPDVVRRMVTTMAIKPKLDNVDIDQILSFVKTLLAK